MDFIEDKIVELIDLIPTIVIPDLTPYIAFFVWLIQMTAYFLPMAILITLFGIKIGLVNFKFIVKLVKTVWNALPMT